MYNSAFVIFFVICTVSGVEEQPAKLRFYNKSFDDYTELPFRQVTDILNNSDWYNSSRSTMFFCHGFAGHPTGPAVTAIIKTYLEQGQSNIVLLNWEYLAAPIYGTIGYSYLNWAVPNAFKLSNAFADTLMTLSEAGLDLNKTHLMGHSLGAHIMGMVGNKLARKGMTLPWITGLDPPGILFDTKHPTERLNPNSAQFVDVMHCDPNKYGSRRSLGTVDFWPNYKSIGYVNQPGCENRPQTIFTMDDLCNHNKCWEYLLDTIKYPKTILASYAKNFRTWKNYSLEQKKANVLELGQFAPNATPGDYYFLTAAASPFGLGEKGL